MRTTVLILPLLLLVTVSSASAADPEAPAWEIIAHEFEQLVTAGGQPPPGLQMVYQPTLATWDDPETGNYQAWRMIGDRISSWSPTYDPQERLVTDGYFAFITNLDLPIPDLAEKAKADKARADYLAAHQRLSKAYKDVPANWTEFDKTQQSLPVEFRRSFSGWFADFDGRTIAATKQDIDALRAPYEVYLRRYFKGWAAFGDLLSEYDNPAYQREARTPSGNTLPYRTYDIVPDLGKWKADAIKAAALKLPPAFEKTFTSSSFRRKTETTSYGGGGFLFLPFLFIGGGGNTSRTTIDTSSSDFSLAIRVESLTTFDVMPGRWFKGTAVAALGPNGPWIKGGPVDQKLFDLWGPKGILNQRTNRIVVAFRPSISLRLKKEDYERVQSNFSAGGVLWLGPFAFGGSYSHSSDEIKFDTSTLTITMQNTSDTPQVIAVVNSILPEQK